MVEVAVGVAPGCTAQPPSEMWGVSPPQAPDAPAYTAPERWGLSISEGWDETASDQDLPVYTKVSLESVASCGAARQKRGLSYSRGHHQAQREFLISSVLIRSYETFLPFIPPATCTLFCFLPGSVVLTSFPTFLH